MTCITAKRLGFAAAAALALVNVAAPAAAQMRAVLPTIDEVEELEPLPIDGVWEIRELGERIVIEGGHAYAEDGWVHMMLFQIEPGQVVIKNIRELANGDFVAQDLPLMAPVKIERVGRGTLRARTEGLIPVTYHLELISRDGPGFGWERPRDDWDDSDNGEDLPPIEAPPARPGDDEDQERIDPW